LFVVLDALGDTPVDDGFRNKGDLSLLDCCFEEVADSDAHLLSNAGRQGNLVLVLTLTRASELLRSRLNS